jgi:hypothetical protein
VAGRDEIDAIRSRIIEIVNDVVQLRRAPPDAAHELDRIRTELVRLEAALDPFVGLAADWDYHPDRRPEVEQHILRAAETLRRNFDT